MKKQLLTLLFTISTIISFSQVPSYVPTNGLVGWWPFNGNANDESGNGNHGTVMNGATIINDRFGLSNKALSLDGIDDRVMINLINNFSNSTTISLWYKSSSQNGGPFVHIGQDNGGSPHCNGFNIGKGGTSLNNQGNDLISGYSGVGYYDSNVSGASGQWHHVVLTKSNNILNFYLNGLFVATINSSNVITPANFVFFGSTSSGFSTLYNGFLDDIAIYSRVLNQLEITDLYNSCLNPIANITTQGNTSICQGSSVNLNASTGSNYTYEWYKNGQLINGATASIYQAITSGNYTVKVVNGACSATSSQTAITVNPLPTATITPQGNTTFCQGGFVNLVASGGSTYQWNTGAQTASISANQAGTFTVNVFNQYNCQASASQTVTVNTNPNVTLSSIPSVVYKTSAPIQLVGNPSGGTYSGDAVSGNTFTPANASLGQKVISYSYTSQQGCSGSVSQTTIVADTVGNVCSTYDTLRIKVKFTAGLYANTTNTVKFYPNPTNDILFIDNGNYQAMSGYSIKIVSLTGTVVYNQPITTQQVQISMNQFAVKGLYFAQIFDPNNQLVDAKKIVLE
jgi:hypothetical protein